MTLFHLVLEKRSSYITRVYIRQNAEWFQEYKSPKSPVKTIFGRIK